MKRFRVFAGPNGSGKSTIIKAVNHHVVDGHTVDFGVYVNADDIAVNLATGKFSFADFELENINNETLKAYAIKSGLLRNKFTAPVFDTAYKFEGKRIVLTNVKCIEPLAQVLSNFLIRQLVAAGKKCTMETVFSHESKIDFMRYATAQGYKVYLYFVATEDVDINVERVKSRVSKGGHDVPEDKIRERYIKSLGLLYDAAQAAYQCYFFDNSGEENQHQLVAHFKMANGRKVWDNYNADELSDWFIQYYVKKQ